MRPTRAGSPQRKTWGAMSPGLHPVMGWAVLIAGQSSRPPEGSLKFSGERPTVP